MSLVKGNPLAKKSGKSVLAKKEKWESHFNYLEEGIEKQDSEELKDLEQDLFDRYSNVKKELLEMGKKLIKAQELLASYDKTASKFLKWCTSMNLSKDFVYRTINRYKLLLLDETKEELIENLPVRTIDVISTKKITDIAREKILEKINNGELNNATDVRNYIKENILSHSAKGSEEPDLIEDAEIIVEIDDFFQEIETFQEEYYHFESTVKEKKNRIAELDNKKRQTVLSEIRKLKIQMDKLLKEI